MPETVWRWGAGASRALQSKARYIDLEGGIRAQKTTALCAWIALGACEEPGSNAFLCRYLDHDVQTILKPKWDEYCHLSGIPKRWNSSEECDELYVHSAVSKVYPKGLKPGDGAQQFSKLRGPTLARIGVDQAEELPAPFFLEMKGRISQPGYTQQIMLTPQPVNPDHWIASEFPIDNPDPDYLYVRTNCYDNRVNLGDAYILELEKAYPEGTAERRTLLEGRRGLALSGEPVYKGAFRRSRHLDATVRMIPSVPLLEAWDYGHHHPCVVWGQVYGGRLTILGAVMGESINVDQFAPVVLEIRNRWLPNPMDVWVTGDPAGMAQSSQGLPVTLRDILANHGIHITAIETANRPEVRNQAIQTIAKYMTRQALDGETAFRIHPRAITVKSNGTEEPSEFLADGFEAGYVWDTKLRVGTVAANVRRPKKDGYYDHGMNCCEYLALAYGAGTVTERQQEAQRVAAVRASQRDDRDQSVGHRSLRRGGY